MSTLGPLSSPTGDPHSMLLASPSRATPGMPAPPTGTRTGGSPMMWPTAGAPDDLELPQRAMGLGSVSAASPSQRSLLFHTSPHAQTSGVHSFSAAGGGGGGGGGGGAQVHHARFASSSVISEAGGVASQSTRSPPQPRPTQVAPLPLAEIDSHKRGASAFQGGAGAPGTATRRSLATGRSGGTATQRSSAVNTRRDMGFLNGLLSGRNAIERMPSLPQPLRIAVVGAAKAGKTQIINRLITGCYDRNYNPTSRSQPHTPGGQLAHSTSMRVRR